ncbi:MAG: hypothetical protein LC689_22540 [Myxococcales bacterium]|nr:hypothetical protein [Myxococcales bacterium]
MHLFRAVAALALIAAPAWARAGGANLYPLAGNGIEAAQLRDLEGQIKSALLRLRSPTLTLDSLDTLEPGCGVATQAKPACLARLARGGVVLIGTVTQSGRLVQVALSAIDGQARATGPVKALVDPAVENLKPLVDALQGLDALVVSGAQPQAPAATVAPGGAPARPRAPRAAVEAERPRGEVWLGRAAIGSGAGAIASLGGALAFGYLARKTNDDLTTRYSQHTLAASDVSSYQNVNKYNKVANALFVVSGVLAAAALTCWAILADDDTGASGLSRM